ncbi:MAG TPA: hypothetical protein PLQ82_13795 [Desulfobacteraceae bacterium]|nr:hypothetical protein [Desulfobacteraceae bacterium]HPQ29542.1 hypothetical protein [Desulfobacteraceae bacterium]
MPLTAEDIVVGIFYFMKKNATMKRVTADREKLHRAFHVAKIDYPEVLSIFSFRKREIFSESAQLDQALSNLDATGLISRQNLTPRYYCFEDSLDRGYTNFSKRIIESAGIKEEDIQKVADYLSKQELNN